MNESKSLTERVGAGLSRYYDNTKHYWVGFAIGYLIGIGINTHTTYNELSRLNPAKEITIIEAATKQAEENKLNYFSTLGIFSLSTLAVNYMKNGQNKKTVGGN